MCGKDVVDSDLEGRMLVGRIGGNGAGRSRGSRGTRSEREGNESAKDRVDPK